VPGLSTLAVQTIIAETGLDMNCWKTEKHFCSWLKLCPDNRISGGQVLSSRAGKTKNRATAMFRLAAQSAMRSQTAIGAFIRRIKSRLGAPVAINAGAHKLARLFYRMLKFGAAYVEQVKPTTSKNTKSACSVISANEPKNSDYSSRLVIHPQLWSLKRIAV
jgi:transposase